MFRDLKEYQEIAKIYAEKVSKPAEAKSDELVENQENRNKLKQSRTIQNQGRVEKQFGFLKTRPSSEVTGSRSRFNTKKTEVKQEIPSTDQIRKDNPKIVPGTRVNETGAKSDKPSEGNFKKDFPDKKPEISKFTKQGKERTKAQMMAAKRIADGKSIADVKADNKQSMINKAKERHKAFLAAKEAKKNKNAAMEEYTPYDIVLEYLLSSEQAATIEEANYVMTEMDAETIQGIVEEQKKTLTEKPDDGYIGPKFLNIKNPITNYINKKRDEKGGGNYRVDEVEKKANVKSGFAGEKIKF